MKYLLFATIAFASPCTHEFATLEMKCLAKVDIVKVSELMKKLKIDKLPIELQELAAHELVNSDILTCIEKEID